MKKLFFLSMIILTIALNSCKKEEALLVPNSQPPVTTAPYVFKQTAFLWQDAWGNGDSTYPVFTYRVAVMTGIHFDSVKVVMTVTLYDSTKITLTENELTNFGQMGCYAPDYQYPEYWIATISDSRGILPPFYNFTQNDIYRLEYQATVKINGTWYNLPKEGRKMSDQFESFWI